MKYKLNFTQTTIKKLTLILTFISIVFSSCTDSAPEANYRKGDVVYMKPDSCKAVVNYVIVTKPNNVIYGVIYTDMFGQRITTTVDERQLY